MSLVYSEISVSVSLSYKASFRSSSKSQSSWQLLNVSFFRSVKLFKLFMNFPPLVSCKLLCATERTYNRDYAAIPSAKRPRASVLRSFWLRNSAFKSLWASMFFLIGPTWSGVSLWRTRWRFFTGTSTRSCSRIWPLTLLLSMLRAAILRFLRLSTNLWAPWLSISLF